MPAQVRLWDVFVANGNSIELGVLMHKRYICEANPIARIRFFLFWLKINKLKHSFIILLRFDFIYRAYYFIVFLCSGAVLI